MTSVRIEARIRNRLLEAGVVDLLSAVGARYVASAMNQLDVLAQIYGTDKSSRYHGYSRYYVDHLGSGRFRRLSLLEIGVGGAEDPRRGGNSLRVWRDYFPRGRIVGADLYPKTLRRLGSRVRVVQCDQSDRASLASLADSLGVIDIIVDDGSHIGEHVWLTLEELFPRLAPGGWYVIEDLHTSMLASHGGAPDPDDSTPIGAVKEAAVAVQALGPVVRSGAVPHPVARVAEIAEVHVYPGIAFFRKANSGSPS